MAECECGHDMWKHEFEDEIVHEDGDESLVFSKCNVEDCKCEHFNEKYDCTPYQKSEHK